MFCFFSLDKHVLSNNMNITIYYLGEIYTQKSRTFPFCSDVTNFVRFYEISATPAITYVIISICPTHDDLDGQYQMSNIYPSRP